MKFCHFWCPLANLFGCPWKIHHWPLPGKNPSDARGFNALEIFVHSLVRASYCVGSFLNGIYKISFIMPRNETGPLAVETCMRRLSICSNNNTTRFATFNKHIREAHATASF